MLRLRCGCESAGSGLSSSVRHRSKELCIATGLVDLVEQQLHRVHRRHLTEDPAQDPNAVQLLGRQQQLFLAGSAAVDVDGREDALVDHLAVEVDFQVAGTLELFENHVVHAASRINQRRGNDGERAALFDVAGGAEEA